MDRKIPSPIYLVFSIHICPDNILTLARQIIKNGNQMEHGNHVKDTAGNAHFYGSSNTLQFELLLES